MFSVDLSLSLVLYIPVSQEAVDTPSRSNANIRPQKETYLAIH